VRQVSYALFRLTEPVLAPIRRFLPERRIDIAPIIAIIALQLSASRVFTVCNCFDLQA